MITLAHYNPKIDLRTAQRKSPNGRTTAILAAAIVLVIGGAAALAYDGFPPRSFGARAWGDVITRFTSDLAQLDELWRRNRDRRTARYAPMPGSIQCVDEVDHHWQAREIADRIEAGERVLTRCLQVRIGND